MMDRIMCVKTVTRNGNSLTINITNEVKLMGIGRGDAVKIVLEAIEKDAE